MLLAALMAALISLGLPLGFFSPCGTPAECAAPVGSCDGGLSGGTAAVRKAWGRRAIEVPLLGGQKFVHTRRTSTHAITQPSS